MFGDYLDVLFYEVNLSRLYLNCHNSMDLCDKVESGNTIRLKIPPGVALGREP